MAIDWTPFKRIVEEHQRFVLTSHRKPDCDALGSELGLAGILTSLGKHVTIVNADPTPTHIAFIDPANTVRVLGRDVTPSDLADADVWIVLDTSAWKQLGATADVLRATSAKRVVIDHHVSEDDLGATAFKETSAEATGRLILDAADALDVALTPDVARALFMAIATDTGWFRFASVSGDTYRAVARLIDAGVVPQEVYTDLYERESFARLVLRGRILASVQKAAGGKLLYAVARLSDFEASGAESGDTEDAINLLLRVNGAEAAILFTEASADTTKVSFRSRGNLDARKVAEQFGGGGHLAAAGATVDEPLDDVLPRILDATRAAME